MDTPISPYIGVITADNTVVESKVIFAPDEDTAIVLLSQYVATTYNTSTESDNWMRGVIIHPTVL